MIPFQLDGPDGMVYFKRWSNLAWQPLVSPPIWQNSVERKDEEERRRARESNGKRFRSLSRKMAPPQATSQRKSHQGERRSQRRRRRKPNRKLRAQISLSLSPNSPSKCLRWSSCHHIYSNSFTGFVPKKDSIFFGREC